MSNDKKETGLRVPAAPDIEKLVLGALLIDPQTVTKGINTLKEEIFYVKAHRIIFHTIVELFKVNEPIDSVTVLSELKRTGQLEDIGGAIYLAELTQEISSAANFEYHARIILERSILRELIGISHEIASTAYEAREDALSILETAEKQIFQITEKHITKSYVPLKDAVNSLMEYIDTIHSNDSLRQAVPTGYYDMDDKLGGFQKSDLIILAARPSMGKTAFALNLATNAARHCPVGVFSLEMSTQQLVMRILCAEAELNAFQVRTGKLPLKESYKLSSSAAQLVKLPIYIDDSPAQTILEVRAKTRRMVKEKGVGMIMIDYLQLMQSADKNDSREREISHISRSLKALAKELEIPIIALAQLNREVEKRVDKRPLLSDLRESGSIEQDADVVMFIHRPDYYNHKVDDAAEQSGDNGPGLAEIIIAKHRNGPTAIVELLFIEEFAKFVSKDKIGRDFYAPSGNSSDFSQHQEDAPF
jgi:replicative DNA helicase